MLEQQLDKYQVMPCLTAEEYSELKNDIARRGVMVPIEFDEAGNVLDGYHRLKICAELGIKEYPKVIRAGMTEDEKLTHARKLNMARRHLTQEQRRELIRQQILANPVKSDRQIAREIGTDYKTVGSQRSALKAQGKAASAADLIRQQILANPVKSDRQIAREIGTDDKTVGAQRSALKAQGVPASAADLIRQQLKENPDKSNRQIAREIGVDHVTVGALRKGGEFAENGEFPQIPHFHHPVSVFNPSAREERALSDSRVVERLQKTGSSNVVQASKQIAEEDKAERKAYTPPSSIPEGAMRLFTADICKGLPEVADGSVDFIITDPPYPKEYIPLYGDLARVAKRVLRSGGSLLVMCGQSYLPDVFSQLSAVLLYHWTLCYLTPGGQSPQLFHKKVNTFWKPVLWFTKKPYEGEYVGDVLKSPTNDNDKRYHEWGQSLGGMKDIIERFTLPGDVILDPFLGGGTTGAAAVTMGRKFIGSDINQENIKLSKERIEALYV